MFSPRCWCCDGRIPLLNIGKVIWDQHLSISSSSLVPLIWKHWDISHQCLNCPYRHGLNIWILSLYELLSHFYCSRNDLSIKYYFLDTFNQNSALLGKEPRITFAPCPLKQTSENMGSIKILMGRSWRGKSLNSNITCCWPETCKRQKNNHWWQQLFHEVFLKLFPIHTTTVVFKASGILQLSKNLCLGCLYKSSRWRWAVDLMCLLPGLLSSSMGHQGDETRLSSQPYCSRNEPGQSTVKYYTLSHSSVMPHAMDIPPETGSLWRVSSG